MEENEAKYYIYAHTIASHDGERPFDEIFYIGRGCSGRSHSKHGRTNYWKKIVNKYGYNIHFLETGLTFEESCSSETRHIKAIGREDLGLGTLINFTDGGEGMKNISEETRKKLSESHKGHVCSEETKKKIQETNKGQIRSEETKKRMSRTRKGIKLSNETRKKMSEVLFGNKRGVGNKGHACLEETKNKINKLNKDKKLSDLHKLKLSESKKGNKNGVGNKGKKVSDETKRKISEANKGRKFSKETRLKMSESKKGNKYRAKQNATLTNS